MYQQLLGKIATRSLRVAVIGLGYVGLSLAVTFAEAGFHVEGLDVDGQKIEKANRGESYIPDIADHSLRELIASGRLHITDDFSVLDHADAISICVPTPLRKTRDPDISSIISATQVVQAHLHAGQLIVLESTTYPGTTDEILLPALESTGMEVGVEFFLAFSPERIDPGNPEFGVRNTPKLVGGVTRACTELAQAFYGAAIAEVIPLSSARVAEMAKLLENTFRAVNIALVNEIAIICNTLGINVWEVIEAAATKPFGFMPFFPGPGLGGHCLPVDPQYLSWKLKAHDYTARFIELATEINSSMPHYIVEKIGLALNEYRRSFNGATILVLGAAYKRNVSDVRESPALDIIQALMERKAEVIYNDEYIPSVQLMDRVICSRPLSDDLLQAADCVVIVTDHSYYDMAWIVREARCIVDTRNATRGYSSEKVRLL